MPIRLFERILGIIVWLWLAIAAWTLRYQIEGANYMRELYTSQNGYIISAWHGRILLLKAALTQTTRDLPKRNIKHGIMISQSRDGNAVALAGAMHGFHTIRGSATNRQKRKDKGGLKALIKSAQYIKSGALFCITPDGPKGPQEQIGEGLILLSRRANAPILPMALSATPAWRLKSWDRFFLPIPFSRGALIFGPPVYLDQSISDVKAMALIQSAMQAVTQRADDLTRANLT